MSSLSRTVAAEPASTRRAFLRSTASASVAAVAAGSVLAVGAMPAAAAHHDAELLALGEDFDRAFAAYKIAAIHANETADAFRIERGPYPRKSDRHHDAYAAAYRREVDPAVIAGDEAAAVADQIANAIRDIPATTLAGVAVKARTLRHDLCKWGDNLAPTGDWDWDDLCLERFICDMQAVGEVFV